jgi:hypothetical protein
MTDRTVLLEALCAKWLTEADQIDADGDICCGLTRRHDAQELQAALRSFADPPVSRDELRATAPRGKGFDPNWGGRERE